MSATDKDQQLDAKDIRNAIVRKIDEKEDFITNMVIASLTRR